MLLILFGEAAAWTLGEAEVVALPEVPTAVVVVERPEGARLVVAEPSGARILAADGTEIAALDVPATAALAHDDDLLLCSGDGFLQVGWPASGPQAAVTLDPSPCSGLVEHTLDGASGVAVATDGGLRVWWDDEGLGDPEDVGMLLDGEVRLATMDAEVAGASLGDTALQVLGARGVSSYALRGDLADVSSGPAGWRVALGDAALLRDLDGADSTLPGPASRLARGDVDGDGTDDTILLFPAEGLVGVLPGDGSALVTADVPVGSASLAVGDLSGDGCADIVVVDPSGPALVARVVTGCPQVPDGDGDGVSSADGDCDDTDASVFPGAHETCDGRDEDCDGLIDEPGGAYIDAPPELDEGDTLLFWAALEGCAPPVTWTWSIAEVPWADCVVSGAEVSCTTSDDGNLVVQVEGTDAEGVPVGGAEAELEVVNVAPGMEVPAAFRDGDLALDMNDTYVDVLRGFDVPGDPVTFLARGAPTWLQLSPSGSLVIEVEEVGSWDVEFVARDDEGGETTFTVRLLASGDPDADADTGVSFADGCEESSSPGWSCCCSSSSALVLLFGAFWRRRPDRRAR